MKNRLSYAIIGIGLVIICGLSSLINNPEGDNFALARRGIVMRMIGHELLLHSGDKTSRVLPVKQFSENHYQIMFEKEFTFSGDTLKAVVNRILEKDEVARDYVVTMINCDDGTVAFGYALGANDSSLDACSGRIQPENCYIVDIQFMGKSISNARQISLLTGVPMLAFLGILVYRGNLKRKVTIPVDRAMDGVIIGNTLFDVEKQTLRFNGIQTELTDKETRIMNIMSSQPNTIIVRSRLQKEIWEDEGVIVGRSLDVFISKLRKKLAADDTVKLVNVHGKGYRLETHLTS